MLARKAKAAEATKKEADKAKAKKADEEAKEKAVKKVVDEAATTKSADEEAEEVKAKNAANKRARKEATELLVLSKRARMAVKLAAKSLKEMKAKADEEARKVRTQKADEEAETEELIEEPVTVVNKAQPVVENTRPKERAQNSKTSMVDKQGDEATKTGPTKKCHPS
ncbi:unnamed protein product [Mytilus coruscus]|uniref:Uncharacterized protein n=1 Tax=Mytilus coruscus TaxID=42192 RepID=A0A6J8D9I2_MYTCO|nr:unnamed protein product [Mytilus coruscus]